MKGYVAILVIWLAVVNCQGQSAEQILPKHPNDRTSPPLPARETIPSKAKKNPTGSDVLAAVQSSRAADSNRDGQTKGDDPRMGAPSNSSPRRVRIEEIDIDKARVSVKICEQQCNGRELTLMVPPDFMPTLRTFRAGDIVLISVNSGSIVAALKLIGRSVTMTDRIRVLVTAFVFCFLLTALLTSWRPQCLIIGDDGRYSNSKFQMAVWFCVLIATYLAVVYLRVSQIGWDLFGGVNIPNNLLMLSGMSALTFAGAKGITTAKVDAAAAKGIPNPKPLGTPHFWNDLTQNDVGHFDFGDFQMLVVTLLAGGMYLISIFHFLNFIMVSDVIKLPNVDTTILAAFGLGQGAYLSKKAAGNVGTS